MNDLSYNIREAVEEDIPELCKCFEIMYGELVHFGLPFELNILKVQEMLNIMIRSKFNVIFVLEHESSISGMLIATASKLESRFKTSTYGGMVGKMTELFVKQELRGRGIAEKLYTKAEEWYKSLGISFIELDVLEQNSTARKFWEKQGFTNMSRLMYKIIDND